MRPTESTSEREERTLDESAAPPPRELDAELVAALSEENLSLDEGRRILKLLGRRPNRLEVGVFGVMWSEHCSYKSSRVHLKNLPTVGPRVALGPGENAGAVRLGRGQVAVFKMESHNHPSYIEPFQGAATGVGGILRDVFTMGARPIANLDSLRFGAADHPKTPHLLRGVVAGIAAYGNCMGVPTVAGETVFHEGYDDNILVNAMTVGLAREDGLFLGRADGVGNPVLYVGSRTGRDGIHGATMASAVFADDAEQKRPTVQVGDPFTEKKLLEACLELFEHDVVVGIQDMGAAGLTSSSIEMADRAGQGLLLHLDRVPMREEGMVPYELMLSESQERMLVVARRGQDEVVRRIFAKWELACEVVGEVCGTGRVELLWHGDRVADLPVGALATQAPRYRRPMRRPAVAPSRPVAGAGAPSELAEVLLSLLGGPAAGSRAPVFEQYDHMVQVRTVIRPGGDAALLRVPEAGGMLAVTADCDHLAGLLDPREGARRTVAEAARNLSATGAEPLAVTDCLNFGNPEDPEVMWAFSEAVLGLREGCLAFETPVISGNVSLYNETTARDPAGAGAGARRRSIPPTPTVGMVGWLPDGARFVGAGVEEAGFDLWLLGGLEASLDGSLCQHELCGRVGGRLQTIDLSFEVRLQDFLRRQIRCGRVLAAHDVSGGGLAVALAEMLLAPLSRPGVATLGFEGLPGGALERGEPMALLFGESPGRVVVAISPGEADLLALKARRWGLPAHRLGRTGGDRLRFASIDLSMADLLGRWRGALAPLFGGPGGSP